MALDGTDDAIDAELQRGRPVLTLIEDRPGAVSLHRHRRDDP